METKKDKTEDLPLYPYNVYRPHAPVKMEITGVSRAKQSFRDECDINTIMAKYQKTGLIEHVNKFEGGYGDLPSADDYQSALNMAIEAKEAFGSLPSSIRNKFENDPEQFLAFVEDPDNSEELIEMGLATAPEEAPSDDTPAPPRPEVEEPPANPADPPAGT